jgi:hypothetical protein
LPSFSGLSLPAHEFLHGLLFVYSVQLDQLTPNSILHIACFITLCEAFLGINWKDEMSPRGGRVNRHF